jgi:hypothetical protein
MPDPFLRLGSVRAHAAATEPTLRYLRLGSFLPRVFASAYSERLRELWRACPELFLGIAAASQVCDVILVDDLDKGEGNPRDILRAALERVAARYLRGVGPTPPAPRKTSANAIDRYVPAVPG